MSILCKIRLEVITINSIIAMCGVIHDISYVVTEIIDV
jgi:hypothetical protein